MVVLVRAERLLAHVGLEGLIFGLEFFVADRAIPRRELREEESLPAY